MKYIIIAIVLLISTLAHANLYDMGMYMDMGMSTGGVITYSYTFQDTGGIAFKDTGGIAFKDY